MDGADHGARHQRGERSGDERARREPDDLGAALGREHAAAQLLRSDEEANGADAQQLPDCDRARIASGGRWVGREGGASLKGLAREGGREGGTGDMI